MTAKSFLCLTLLSLLLAGCATTPKTQFSHPTELHAWQLQGKLALRVPNKAQSAYFTWNNDGDYYDIRVNGPLGQGAAYLKKDSKGVTLQLDGQDYKAQTGEQLMQQHLGWSFPVSRMNWWVKGLAAPDTSTTQQQMNEQGLLEALEQQGWKVRFLSYQEVAGLQLPYKIVARKQQIQLTLLLKKWRLHR